MRLEARGGDCISEIVSHAFNRHLAQIDDLRRSSIPLDPGGFTLAHANNTLLITYAKPAKWLEVEKALKVLRDQLNTSADGDVDCATQ